MPKSTKRPKRAIGFECLENRSMMAGDVTAAVVSGVLQITGDAAANSITVKQSGNVWTVQGQSTRVNGSTSIQRFSGVTDIDIELLAGNDTVSLTNGTLTGELAIAGGKGNNTVSVSNLAAYEVDLRSEEGIDTFRLTNVHSDSSLLVKTYFFNSTDQNDSVTLTNSTAADRLEILTGAGADTVTVQNSEAGTFLDIQTFAGNDIVRLTSFSAGDDLGIFTGEDNDAVSLQTVVSGADLVIDTGAINRDGNDGVSITRAIAGETLDIDTGNGNDAVSITGLEATDLAVTTAATTADGNDTVTIFKALVERFIDIETGNGSDQITMNEIEVGIDLRIITWGSASDANDSVRLTTIAVGNDLILETGNGTDYASLNFVLALNTIDCKMQAGNNDRLAVTNSAALLALFNGGGNPGDQLIDLNNTFVAQVNTGFASIIT